jgi:predicted phosphodiesterase
MAADGKIQGDGMTKLWIASDLHHGESISHQPAPAHDVFVCAGDWSRLDTAIDTLQSGIIGNGPTVLVPGNHEYYGTVIEDAERAGAELAGGSRVFLLNPGVAVLGGVRFLGCTLWTDYALFGREGFAQAMAEASVGLNDHRLIRTRAGCQPGWARLFTPEDALRRHQREPAWLEARLSESFEGPTVVVSHHGISPRSVPERFRTDPMTPAFSSDLEATIVRHQPDLWIHGHTHDSFDYQIGRARVICNPAGYSYESNRGYQRDLVIDLPTYRDDDEPLSGISP